MLDRHEAHENQIGGQNGRAKAGDAKPAARQLADREVPLPGADAAPTMTLHSWLDGDLTESDARRVDSKGVELWARIEMETSRRRRMTTPAHLSSQIMAALPNRDIALRLDASTMLPSRAPATAKSATMVVAAGFFTLGIVVGKLFLR